MRALAIVVLFLAPAIAAAAPGGGSNTAVTKAVKAVLSDPDSAKFRDIRPTGNDSYCGWVNAKNGYGGFAGDQLFYDDHGFVQIMDLAAAASLSKDPEFGPKIKPCLVDARL